MFHNKSIRFLLVFLLSAGTDLFALSQDFYMPMGMIAVTTDFHYASPTADTMPSTFYARNYSQPMSVKGELGSFAAKPLYVALTFDVFKAGRIYDDGSGSITDTLTLNVVGLEAGYVFMNPRAFFIASGFVGYPLQISVASSTTDVYSPNSLPLSYGGRAMVGLRLVPWIAVLVQGGYQFRNLGDLDSQGNLYPPGAGSLDLTGMFLSVGLGLCL